MNVYEVFLLHMLPTTWVIVPVKCSAFGQSEEVVWGCLFAWDPSCILRGSLEDLQRCMRPSIWTKIFQQSMFIFLLILSV